MGNEFIYGKLIYDSTNKINKENITLINQNDHKLPASVINKMIKHVPMNNYHINLYLYKQLIEKINNLFNQSIHFKIYMETLTLKLFTIIDENNCQYKYHLYLR